MMNTETGEIKKVSDEEAKKLLNEKGPDGKSKWVGPFKVGMIMDINGGMFQISSIGKRAMVLQALAGTRMFTKDETGKDVPVK